jgi:hypothetical protein
MYVPAENAQTNDGENKYLFKKTFNILQNENKTKLQRLSVMSVLKYTLNSVLECTTWDEVAWPATVCGT